MSTLLLQGCAQQPTPEMSVATPTESAVIDAQTHITDKPFSAETLYALLVAEIAGSRQHFDVALANYMQQAVKTRDIGVTARATYIARFVEQNDAALSMATLWVELAPTNLEARFILGVELTNSGHLFEAIPHSLYLLEHGGSTLFKNIAAQAARSTDTQQELLLQEFQKLQQSHPDNAEIALGLGLLNQQLGNLEKALTHAREATKLNDSLLSSAILEAQILHAQDKLPAALERLHTLLQQHPNDTRLRLQYARLLTNNDVEAARAQFKELIKQNPNDPELQFSLGLINIELGRLQEAQTTFEALLKFPQRQSSAHYYLGKIAQQQQQLDTALMHFSEVAPGPDYLTALLQSVHILVHDQRLEHAHDLLSSARHRFPQHSERLHLIEVDTLTEYGYLDAAVERLNHALKSMPNNIPMLYSRAMVHDRLNNIVAMEKDLRTIIAYSPNNATALNALGYSLANKTTRYQEALALISQALQIKPTDPAIIDSMGWVQYRLGNHQEAILRLRQAFKDMPDPEIASHLGEVLWVDDQRHEALQVWQQGLELDADSELIINAMERLGASTE